MHESYAHRWKGVKRKMKKAKRVLNTESTAGNGPSKSGQIAEHVQALVTKFRTRAGLADAVGKSESRISEWLTGKRQPTPGDLIVLGKLAQERRLKEPLFFWESAGLDAQSIIDASDMVTVDRIRPAHERGDIIFSPRYRLTMQGSEPAGSGVPLPGEFVRDAAHTVCVVIDEKSTAVVDSPKGLLILDTSCKGTRELASILQRVVVLRLTHGDMLLHGEREGIYVGRLEQFGGMISPMRPDDARLEIGLFSLTQTAWALDGIAHYDESGALKGLPPGDTPERRKRLFEFEERAIPRIRTLDGIGILGEVIGRLSGHIKGK
jgi:transcriptional regulator with XRE-family HTH domain